MLDLALAAELTPLYHYVIVRNDLPLGVLAAQVVHAAGESSLRDIPPDTHAVVLAVSSEQELQQLEQDLLYNRIQHKAIREPDQGNELMAIGIVPIEKKYVKKVLSKYPLLK